MIKLSVIVITRNEEKNIRGCLESVKWANEIIVVDQSSTDKTVDISREYTDKVFVVESKGYCEPDRMFAISKTTSNWIFYIDADEIITPELEQEIRHVISKEHPEYECYYVPRKTHFLGKWIKGCGWYPAHVLRLFKKGTVNYSENIHHDGTTINTCGYLKNDLMHLSYKTLDEYFEKFNRYTSRLAQEEFEKGVKISNINFLLYFLIKPLVWFLKKYFLQSGWKDGFIGFFISFSSGLVLFTTYTKLWEIQNNGKN